MHTLKAIVCAIFFAASQFAASDAAATVIDFEEIKDATKLPRSGLATQGYRLGLSDVGFAFVFAATGNQSTLNGNGTKRLLSFNGADLTITALNNSAFNLFSFEGGETWLDGDHRATQIKVVGTLAGGGSTTQVFDLDLIRDLTRGMQDFTLGEGFRNLQSVTFIGIGSNSEFSIDNISVTAVPEPLSSALLLLGAAGIAASRRRPSR